MLRLFINLFKFLKVSNNSITTTWFQYYTKDITSETIAHYVKYMNNIKIIDTKETIMTNNNFTERVTQKQSNGKILKNYAVHHSNLRIQPKPGGNNTKMTHLHRCSTQNPPLTLRVSPLRNTSGLKASDVYNMLDILKNPLFILMDKILTSPKTSSSFTSKKGT